MLRITKLIVCKQGNILQKLLLKTLKIKRQA